MAFRSTPVATATFATPTQSIDVGDVAVSGVGPFSASSQHQHAFPAAALGTALAPGGLADLSPTYVARGAALSLFAPGGILALSALYASLAAAGVAIRYVSAAGNDANDGLSWGSAKLTVAAAGGSVPTGAAGQAIGLVEVGAGTFSSAATIEVGYGTAAAGGGFWLHGQGRGVTNLVYTGAGTAVRFANYATAEQKWYLGLSGFTLSAPSAAVALDLTGSTQGHFHDLDIVGNTGLGNVVAGSVGVKLDGRYGGAIGCWGNRIHDSHVIGFERDIQITGVPAAGQANENHIGPKVRVGTYTLYGIDIDVGDHIVVDDCDLTTGGAPTAAIRVNTPNCDITSNRFESLTTVCVLIDAGADNTNVAKNYFATPAASTAIKMLAASEKTSIGPNRLGVAGIVYIVDQGTATNTSSSSFGDWASPHWVPIRYAKAAAGMTASMTNVDVDLVGSIAGDNRAEIGRPYQIRMISVKLSTALTAGTLTLQPTIGGAATTQSMAMTPASTSAARKIIGMAVDADAGTNTLGLRVTTDAGFLPSGTINLEAIVWIEFSG